VEIFDAQLVSDFLGPTWFVLATPEPDRVLTGPPIVVGNDCEPRPGLIFGVFGGMGCEGGPVSWIGPASTHP